MNPEGATPELAGLDPQVSRILAGTKGFMPEAEGLALYRAGLEAANLGLGPLVEVGAYCGKSSLLLGAGARGGATVLFSVDHHRGSQENQPGWEHHDPSLVDARTGRMDTLPTWRWSVEAAGLEPWVIAVVGDSATIAAHWGVPLAMVFIDGGHGPEPAWADYRGWAPYVALGGLLAIHDVFADPAEGGRPPYGLWRAALSSGAFVEDSACGSLRVLRRVGPGQ